MLSLSSWRTPPKSAIPPGQCNSQHRRASDCSKEIPGCNEGPHLTRELLEFQGQYNLIRGRIFWQGSEHSDCFGVLGLDIWKGFKLLPFQFCHQRARLPALPGDASACKDKGIACWRSLMSFFSHLPYTCISHSWLDLKPCLRRKRPENFSRGGRESSRLSLCTAWDSIWHVSFLRRAHSEAALPTRPVSYFSSASFALCYRSVQQPQPCLRAAEAPGKAWAHDGEASCSFWPVVASWVVNQMLTPPSQPLQNTRCMAESNRTVTFFCSDHSLNGTFYFFSNSHWQHSMRTSISSPSMWQ